MFNIIMSQIPSNYIFKRKKNCKKLTPFPSSVALKQLFSTFNSTLILQILQKSFSIMNENATN